MNAFLGILKIGEATWKIWTGLDGGVFALLQYDEF